MFQDMTKNNPKWKKHLVLKGSFTIFVLYLESFKGGKITNGRNSLIGPLNGNHI